MTSVQAWVQWKHNQVVETTSGKHRRYLVQDISVKVSPSHSSCLVSSNGSPIPHYIPPATHTHHTGGPISYHQQPTLTTLVVPSPNTCIPPATHTHHTGGPIPQYMYTTSNPHSPHWWSHLLLHVYHQQPTLTTLVVPSPTTRVPEEVQH